ncbi:MAG: glycosyltransferase family 1 protein, partial [Phycisphaerales bacterium]|nr:glycosyltransferase family 1 protein [Phycisphaerales bacterium]
MRIALITDAWFPQINGVVTTLDHVRRELEDAGHTFLVIHPGLFRTIPCPKYREIRLSVLPGRKFRRLIREFGPQAVHIATEGPLGLAGRRYCRRRGLPFTSSYHTQFPLYLKKYFWVPRRFTYALMRWFHNSAVRTLVPTPSVRDELTARGFKSIRVWTRGVDTALFKPHGKGFFTDPRPIFLYAGRVAHEKNIEAFLCADLPGTKVVVGNGPAMTRLVREYPRVKFVGFKHGMDLARHVAAADVFVFPSKTDTFGIVMLEAMASGLPVAAYRVTGPIDVVKNGVSGVLDDDLAKAALGALELDPERCRDYALEFSWKRCA